MQDVVVDSGEVAGHGADQEWEAARAEEAQQRQVERLFVEPTVGLDHQGGVLVLLLEERADRLYL